VQFHPELKFRPFARRARCFSPSSRRGGAEPAVARRIVDHQCKTTFATQSAMSGLMHRNKIGEI